MNEVFHIVLGLIIIIFFLIAFIVSRKPYQLLVAVLTAYTFLIYLSDSLFIHKILGVGAFVLCVVTGLSILRARRQEHAQTKLSEASETREGTQ